MEWVGLKMQKTCFFWRYISWPLSTQKSRPLIFQFYYSSMKPELVFTLLFSFISTWKLVSLEAKVFVVLMEDDPVVMMSLRNDENIAFYKERMTREHDIFLESLLEKGSYIKLYSYTHLLNGFAIYSKDKKVLDMLETAEKVRLVHEDTKLQKLTTHTPELLGITTGVWPSLGGSMLAGEGVVIGLIDTGINPFHPSFTNEGLNGPACLFTKTKFKGKCSTGEQFPPSACSCKIVGAQYFARAAIAAGEFNSTRDFASPFDADGHGSHTASTAAGNHGIPVIANNFNYGFASGMAPGAQIAVYKALYPFGGYMSDVVAAVDQAVEDGVDVLSLSIGPARVPSGPSAFLNVLELELLFATKAGVLVVQAAGNGGPSSSSILSFSPWITSVAASITDRRYNNSIILGDGQRLIGTGLAPPTVGGVFFPVAAAADVCQRNITAGLVESCQDSDPFILTLVRGRLIICTYTFDFESEAATIATVADTISKIGAAGFILTMDPDIGSEKIKGATVPLQVPGVILNNMESSSALWEYYNSNTVRSRSGIAISFRATARILDGREATYTGQAPVVASYSSRGPDVNNALLETADVLKPTIMAPGSSIWAAWSPNSEGDQYIKGQSFALLSGTSMATPHIAGIAALIKQKHPDWSPAAITSAMMTTANITATSGAPILAQQKNKLSPATPFDFGAGFINPSKAIDPGLIFDIYFKHYVQFLCTVPGVDDMSVRRAVGVGCPSKKTEWCSDLNTASVTVSNLVGSRKVTRRVTNVGELVEKYTVLVREPFGVNITVTPQSFKISVNASRHITLFLVATQMTNAYTFGEMMLEGNNNHVVRVPISVYVSSTLGF
ncbi:subtilisin-like protease SBT2.5 isoform X2 [Olea europaea var. sylvestris]|uniref:subtilisin-like protease SBT2.5 isoform X2 n=1 Tax=Olea europaea var. sylvestris TaxID=158386 RepID=UPI000C1D0D60|nr:subtilisin-like protease SBT2.5 isoform X2 [Olea europaea var. sylvestris]